MSSYQATYYVNINIRDKSFKGYQPDTDVLGRVGTIEISGDRSVDSALEAAFRSFNRIDVPVPVLDEAEAPSMSVGDICSLTKDDSDIVRWFVVASAGFKEIDEPTTISSRSVRELLDSLR